MYIILPFHKSFVVWEKWRMYVIDSEMYPKFDIFYVWLLHVFGEIGCLGEVISLCLLADSR